MHVPVLESRFQSSYEDLAIRTGPRGTVFQCRASHKFHEAPPSAAEVCAFGVSRAHRTLAASRRNLQPRLSWRAGVGSHQRRPTSPQTHVGHTNRWVRLPLGCLRRLSPCARRVLEAPSTAPAMRDGPPLPWPRPSPPPAQTQSKQHAPGCCCALALFAALSSSAKSLVWLLQRILRAQILFDRPVWHLLLHSCWLGGKKATQTSVRSRSLPILFVRSSYCRAQSS